MRTLVLSLFLFYFILPFITGKSEKLKGTAMAGKKKLTCSFTLIYKDLMMDLKKSKALCKPKLKRTVRIPDYMVNGTDKLFTFTMTIEKKGKVTLSKATIVQTGPAPACGIGLTLVCGTVSSEEVDTMTEVCPAPARTATPELSITRMNESCSCLPTTSVEQDLESGISPLGQGCVTLGLTYSHVMELVTKTCPSGWGNPSDSGNCYKFMSGRRSWADALLHCQQTGAEMEWAGGASLALIGSSSDQGAVMTAPDGVNDDQIHIGGFRNGTENNWYWTDLGESGEKEFEFFGYTNFMSGVSRMSGTCLTFINTPWGGVSRGQWNDASCNDARSSICRVEAA